MGSTPNYGLRYPTLSDTPDVVRDVTDLANDVEDAIAALHAKLPAPLASGSLGGVSTGVGTSYADIGATPFSFTTPADVWGLISFFAYMKVGGTSTSDLSIKLVLSGATVLDSNTAFGLGGTLYQWSNGTEINYGSHGVSFPVKLLAGTTVMTVHGYHSAAANSYVISPLMAFTPTGWATDYV